jgi:hypothetical protein
LAQWHHQNKKVTPDLTSNAFESNAFEKVTFRFTVPLEQRHHKNGKVTPDVLEK